MRLSLLITGNQYQNDTRQNDQTNQFTQQRVTNKIWVFVVENLEFSRRSPAKIPACFNQLLLKKLLHPKSVLPGLDQLLRLSPNMDILDIAVRITKQKPNNRQIEDSCVLAIIIIENYLFA